MAHAATEKKPLDGRTVLFTVVAFFAVIFAVNGIILAFAISTNTGIVANEPYRKGLKYNERILADEQQAELGWRSEVSYDATNGSLTVSLCDRDGKPLSGLSARIKWGRAVTNRDDVIAPLTEVSAGQYGAVLNEKEAGSFLVDLEVLESGDGSRSVIFRDRRRLWLKP